MRTFLLLVLWGCGPTVYSYDPDDPCLESTEPTPGRHGVASFTHDEGGIGCMFGCSLDGAFAAGGYGVIRVIPIGSSLPTYAVTSATPDVATFTAVDAGAIVVETLSAGTAVLVLEADGVVLDEVEVRVKDVAAIEIYDFDDELELLEGGDDVLFLDGLSDEACELHGAGWLTATSSEPTVVTLDGGAGDALEDWLAGVLGDAFVGFQEELRVDALVAGLATVTLEAPSGAGRQVPVEVLAVDALTGVRLETDTPEPAVGDGVYVHAHGVDPEGDDVSGIACDWSVEGGRLTAEGTDSVAVWADSAGTAVVTCAIPEHEGTISIAFQ